MNQDKKNIKNYVLLGIIIIIVIIAIVCFIIAYKNHSNKTDDTNAEEDIITYDSDYKITEPGSYDITGNNECIIVNTSGIVELKLNNSNIICSNGPAINVVNAEEVNIVIVGENKINATTNANLNGAIYSKSDLVFSGDGSLSLTSNYDGIISKDNLTISSGTINITSSDDGLIGRDSIEIVDGIITINSKGDGVKTTNEEDSDKGYIVISGGELNIETNNDGIYAYSELIIKDGTFNIKTTLTDKDDSAKGLKAGTLIQIDGGKFDINAEDDGIHSNKNVTINNGIITINSDDDAIHADGKIEINNGTLNLIAHEGIEATYVIINNGDINIKATDDGINAGNKSNEYSVNIEINGGNITIDMGQGDTDAIDSNGNLYINGGNINITARSAFDYDKEGKYNGGTIIVNGSEVNTLSNQMMGGQMGGPGGPNQNRGRMR